MFVCFIKVSSVINLIYSKQLISLFFAAFATMAAKIANVNAPLQSNQGILTYQDVHHKDGSQVVFHVPPLGIDRYGCRSFRRDGQVFRVTSGQCYKTFFPRH
jgi:hypothetical protein